MLASLFQLELGAFLFGLAAIVGYQLLTRQINMAGLFDYVDPGTGERKFSPGRVQLLILTLVSSGYYVLQVFEDPSNFPDIPEQLLWLQGGSSGIYLSGKAIR